MGALLACAQDEPCQVAILCAGRSAASPAPPRRPAALPLAAPAGTLQSDFLKHGPQGTPLQLQEGSPLRVKLHLCAAGSRYRPCAAGTLPPPQQQQQQQQAGEEG